MSSAPRAPALPAAPAPLFSSSRGRFLRDVGRALPPPFPAKSPVVRGAFEARPTANLPRVFSGASLRLRARFFLCSAVTF
ncbi:hypothetical protein PAL_GLEAN10003239 [Pteropus alecto]|uniref:Uncharacterized protein n=1 Tax=Pteropus alecto TaxID=9402 RepID=L5JV54_PTEAL|nr:hypothetical protein PAL_GLEAN10003239 [Pteropus alecto]